MLLLLIVLLQVDGDSCVACSEISLRRTLMGGSDLTENISRAVREGWWLPHKTEGGHCQVLLSSGVLRVRYALLHVNSDILLPFRCIILLALQWF